MSYERCPNDPCVYSKTESDGSVTTVPLYVDDGRYYYDSKGKASSTALEDMAAFAKKFEVKYGEIDPLEDWFLSSNRVSPALGACSVRCSSYIDQMVDRYLGGDISPSKKFPVAWGYAPADDTLVNG